MDRIASGGMAEIYRALDPLAPPERQVVALKLILPHYGDDPEFLEMMRDEAEITRHLLHPNLATVLEYGQADGRHYLAIEYIHGRDLRAVTRESRQRREYLPVEHACYVLAGALRGLHSAHTQCDERGQPLHVVHRDVSPSNILVPFQGDVKVIDFGIAKAALRKTRTRIGIVKGKVHYMSPEQSEGKALDPRSDVFSAGAVLYEALTLRLPFFAASETETVELLRHADPQPPSHFDPAIPGEVDQIVMKALSKKRSERYQSAADMASALDQLLVERYAGYQTRWVGEYLAQMFDDGPLDLEGLLSEVQAGLSLAENEPGTAQVKLPASRRPGLLARLKTWLGLGGRPRRQAVSPGPSAPRVAPQRERSPEQQRLIDPSLETSAALPASELRAALDAAARAAGVPLPAPAPGARPTPTPPPVREATTTPAPFAPAPPHTPAEPAAAPDEEPPRPAGQRLPWHLLDIHPPSEEPLSSVGFLPVLPGPGHADGAVVASTTPEWDRKASKRARRGAKRRPDAAAPGLPLEAGAAPALVAHPPSAGLRAPTPARHLGDLQTSPLAVVLPPDLSGGERSPALPLAQQPTLRLAGPLPPELLDESRSDLGGELARLARRSGLAPAEFLQRLDLEGSDSPLAPHADAQVEVWTPPRSDEAAQQRARSGRPFPPGETFGGGEDEDDDQPTTLAPRRTPTAGSPPRPAERSAEAEPEDAASEDTPTTLAAPVPSDPELGPQAPDAEAPTTLTAPAPEIGAPVATPQASDPAPAEAPGPQDPTTLTAPPAPAAPAPPPAQPGAPAQASAAGQARGASREGRRKHDYDSLFGASALGLDQILTQLDGLPQNTRQISVPRAQASTPEAGEVDAAGSPAPSTPAADGPAPEGEPSR